MEVVFLIAETITAENEPASLVFAGLKNERVKETNPRKGTETKKPLGAFFILPLALWGFTPTPSSGAISKEICPRSL